MAVSAAVASVAVAAAGTAYSVYSGERAASAQQKALQQQEAAQAESMAMQKSQAQKAEQNINRANRRQPDVAGIAQGATQMAGQGPSGTMLTGPMGVDPSQLQLGKSTLLGG